VNGSLRGGPVDDQPQLFPLVSPLSDGWHELRHALQTVRASGRDTMPAAELEEVGTALRLVERALREAGQLP